MVFEFKPEQYGTRVASLLADAPLCELGPGQPNRGPLTELDSLDAADLFEGKPIRDGNMAQACLAGLWLRHNDLDRSHTISQSIPTAEGSFWHGIMHRREPDPSNAKYWFRKVGQHAIFDDLLPEARALIEAESSPSQPLASLANESRWDAFHFIDCCDAHMGNSDHNEALCKQIQEKEWQLLFDYCYRKALGQ